MSANERPIWFVCKDPGGTNGILPVYDHLKREGLPVVLIANGKAVELLQTQGREFVYSFSGPSPRVLVTSMCSGGGLGRDVIPTFRGRYPTVALQDFWGSYLWSDWADHQWWPDYIVVNDEVGAQIVREAWPNFGDKRIKILGYPALDKYAGVDTASVRQEVHEKLGMKDDRPMVLYAGQLDGTSHALAEVCNALTFIRPRSLPTVNLMPRLHPRLRTNAPHEYKQLNQALHTLGYGLVWPFTEICETAELVQAADIVVSEWSTVLVDAAAARRVPIAVLYPGEGQARFERALGGDVKEFPLVSLGCAAKATSRRELTQVLSEAVAGKLHEQLRPAQEQHFKVDGKNAQRVADFIKSLL